GLGDGRLRRKGHRFVALGVGVQAVVGELGGEQAAVVGGDGEVVQVAVAAIARKPAHPGVELLDVGGAAVGRAAEARVLVGVIVADRQDGCQNRGDAIGGGEVGNHLNVVLDRGQVDAARQIVGASKQHHHARLQVEHVG